MIAFRQALSKFPLVTLEQDDPIPSIKTAALAARERDSAVLWIDPPPVNVSGHEIYRPWASSHPLSLEYQLLLLLSAKDVDISFKPWERPDTAPDGTLPALHLISDRRLLSTKELERWLVSRYNLSSGETSEETDFPMAVDTLIAGDLRNALVASKSESKPYFHLNFPIPPSLAAGLKTPLPASLTGDARRVDLEGVINRGLTALDVLEDLAKDSDVLEVERCSVQMQAVMAAHLYSIYMLPSDSTLRNHMNEKETLLGYMDNVMSRAQQVFDRRKADDT